MLVAVLFAVMVTVPESVLGSTQDYDPDADGDASTWVVSGCTDHHDCVDDGNGTQDGDTTHLYTSIQNKRELWHVADPSESGTITNVRLYLTAKIEAGGDDTIEVEVKTNGVVYTGTAFTPAESYGDHFYDWAQNPFNTSAWNWGDIKLLQIGGIAQKIGAQFSDLFITAAWLTVTYTAGAPDIEEFYWTGAGDGYKWDDEANWKGLSGGTWYDPGSGDYPKSNVDQAFFNESSSSLYLVHGAQTSITIGELTTSSGFTGSITFSIDLIIDDAGGENGHFDHQAAATIDVNTSNEGITVDSHFNVSSSSTFTERSGTVTLSGATTQEVRVQSTNKLYQLTLANSGTIAELHDNLTLYKVTVPTGTTLKADANTRGYELWMNFSDTAGSGIDIASAGTLDFDGASSGRGANISTADGSPPPTNHWNADVSTGDMTLNLDYATLSYGSNLKGGGTWNIQDCTVSNFETSTYAVEIESGATITNFNDNTISSTTYGFSSATASTSFSNIVLSTIATTDIRANDVKLEFTDSNFDTSQVNLATSGNVISSVHNDVANAYKIMATTLSKSTVTNDYATLSDVQLVSGTYTIDEASASDDYTIDSGTTLVLNTGQTHTFDPDANMTNNGVVTAIGDITTSSGYFDLYNANPAHVWLNDSSVDSADLDYYHSGFNCSIGSAKNSTLDDFTIETASTMAAFNFTYVDFSNKGSGIVAHWNVTQYTGSERIKFLVGNLTASKDYEVYIDSTLANETTADGSGQIFFSNNTLTYNHIYITWVPGENWLTGWLYRKSHVIKGATGAGTNYQVKVKTMYGSTKNVNYTSQASNVTGWANAWDSNNDNYMIVQESSDYFLYRSTDEGRTFSKRWTPPDSADTYRYFCFVTSSDRLFVNTENHGSGDSNRLYYSDNGGSSFTQVTDANISNMKFWPMEEDASGNLYIGRYEASTNTADVFKSTNDGVNWTDISDATWDDSYVSGSRHIHEIRYDPTSTWFYVNIGDDGPADGLWRSKLGDGSDWVLKNNTQGIGVAFKDSYVYDGSDTGNSRLFRFIDDGTGSEQDMTTLLDLGAVGAPFILKEDNSARLWAGFYEVGLYTSDDGTTWIMRETARTSWDAFMHGSHNFPSISGEDVFISKIVNGYALRMSFDSDMVVTLDNHAETDFGDVRFTDDDGDTELDYWMENKTDSDFALFWVEVADDLGSDRTIYVYYGKGGESTTSNGGNTFLVFDHFDNGVIDNPPWTTTGDASESGSQVTIGDAADDWDNIETTTAFGTNRSFHAYINRDWSAAGSASIEGMSITTASNHISIGHQSDYDRIVLQVGGSTLVDQKTEANHTEAHIHHEISWAYGYSLWSINGTGKGAYSSSPTVTMDATLRSYYSGNYLYGDWAFLRKFVHPEPQHGDWGAEEAFPCPSTIYSIATGDWKTAGTWKDNCIPATGDTAVVCNGHTVTLDDNRTAKIVQVNSTATLQIGDSTPSWNVTLTFDDASGAGFVAASSGSLNIKGTSTYYGMNITSANDPPANAWQASTNMAWTADWCIIKGHDKVQGASATFDIENCTMENTGTDYVFASQGTMTAFNNNTLTSSAGGGMYVNTGHTEYYNIVITSAAGKYDVGTDASKRTEFRQSNFDMSKLVFGAIGGGTGGNITSMHHNDVTNNYKIATGTWDSAPFAAKVKKSEITYVFGSSDNVEITEGGLRVDANAEANRMFVLSSAEVEVDSGFTLDVTTNLTVNGTLVHNGTITDSGNYFDFYIGGGSVYLNNSTVSQAKLAMYLGGFNFTVGNSANSTINEWTLEAPSGQDTDFNVTFYDFNRKGSGVIWQMNVTAASGTVKMCTTNLTAGETYRSYKDGVQNSQGTASGDAYNFTVAMSTHHVNLTWISGVPPGPEPPGPGQYDRWIVGFEYSKNFFTNEVRLHAVFRYDYNASWYIWDFDGVIYESASPNITHNFQFAFYSTENVKLTIIATDGNRYWTESPIVLDNSLWIALLCLAVICFAVVAIMHTRRKRRREELIMVESEGR
jgi:hypothetical protein